MPFSNDPLDERWIFFNKTNGFNVGLEKTFRYNRIRFDERAAGRNAGGRIDEARRG